MDLEFTSWGEVASETLEEMIAKNLEDERALLVALLIQLNIVFRRNL